jgi:uncharacterized peroxidase-related enzyme
MAYIPLPGWDEMAPEVRDALEAAKAKTGEPGEIAFLVARHPGVFSVTMHLVRTLLLQETRLPYAVKERIALLVSVQNRCDMCVGEHTRIAQMLGMSEAEVEAAISGLDAMDLPAREHALLAFCQRAASGESHRITAADVEALEEAGWSDEEVLEAVAVAGYFNYINTISNALGAGK